MGLPEKFLARLEEQYPQEFKKILRSFHQRLPVVRTNTRLISVQQLLKLFKKHSIEVQAIPELPNALQVTNADRKQLTALPEYEDGSFYIQSIASQLVVSALDPQPGEKIFDMCAAPGSKTSQIALQMNCEGELIANEPNKSRFFKLLANLRHQHLVTFVTSKQYPGQNYPAFYPEYFDRILVDAPCSSESRFVEDDAKTTQYWSQPKVKAFAKLQKKLLRAALQCLKPGGIVVYSTCSFSPEENEAVISDLLSKFPEVETIPLPWQTTTLPILSEWQGKIFHPGLANALRLFPDDWKESFFICALKKGKTLPATAQANKLVKSRK